MPIRTNRGRAAVYRKLWAWPLRSPRHLAGALVLFAVLATVIGLIVPDRANPLVANRAAEANSGARTTVTSSVWPTGTRQPGPSGTEPSLPRATGTTGVPGDDQPRGPVTTTPPEPADVDPDALAVATAWAAAWVTHREGMTNAQWTAQLAPFTTEEFLPQLASIDPSNIPSTEVTGEPVASSATTHAVEVDVPTDGAILHLTLVSTPDGWRVAAYDRSD